MWRAIDLVLRIIYLVIAPLMLVICAAILPITGLMISAGLATIVAMFGAARWKQLVGRIPVIGRGLGGMSRLGEFYAEHPPKPLVYYIFYPVLLPVILFMRIPRRELLLYRKLGAVALVILVAVPAQDYLRHWQPDLPFGFFFATIIVGLIFQLLAIFSLIMPIVTTFVMLRERRLYKTLALVVVLGIGSAVVAYLAMRHAHQMPFSRWMRIEARTFYADKRLHQCQAEHPTDHAICEAENAGTIPIARAIDAAAKVLVANREDLDGAEAAAREQLEALYKSDEAAEFRVYAGSGVVCVFVQYAKNPALWLARDRTGFFHDPAKLPEEARKLLKL
jgi:hypothetical protein